MDNPDPTKFQNNPIVTLNVGLDKHTFHVHQALLFEYSPVFKAAFSGKCRESSERCMALPEDDPETVERFMQWLYFKSIGLTKGVSPETWDECSLQLARLNTLADKFDVGLLKNSIIDELFALAKIAAWLPETPVIAYIYENTTETSSLRKLIVEWHVWQIDYDWYTHSDTRADLKTMPAFVADLAIAMSRRVQDPSLESPFHSDPSSYYEDRSTTSGD
ncbi:hypothetical protein JMJ35_001945 [Cladonia borealis]|uniref:BTB domain-containing protein n=1 Tax=Cladonia borealis TaxID=184061 RepID=A0AA39R8A1_9LECA|nr:hypothetical protein JMJ35_001945 [Cladonia borealis]